MLALLPCLFPVDPVEPHARNLLLHAELTYILMMETNETDLWFPRSKKTASQVRLFCFPHAGGGAAKYHAWSNVFPDAIELLPARLPGREERFREPAVDSIEVMVESMGKVMPEFFDRPFALLGHSMGALIAFEMARLLRRDYGVAPVCLFVAAFPSPQVASFTESIHAMPDAELLSVLRDRYRGLPEEVADNAELMQLMLPVIRADFKAVETHQYRPEPPLSCPIVAMAGDEDGEVSIAEVSAWREQTIGGFSLQIFPGHHFFLYESPQSTARPVIRRLMGS